MGATDRVAADAAALSGGQEVLALRAVAVQVASEAAELVQRLRGGLSRFAGQVDTKSTETDVVTAADRASEELIRARLAELAPGDGVIGEEQESLAGTTGQHWVVDPIDGTVNYLYGLPWYAVSIGVQRGGVSVASAVVEPATGRVWSAALGHGAEVDGQPLRASATTRLDLSLVATGFAYAAPRRARQADVSAALTRKVRDLRRTGSAALDLCAVAAGWVDAYFEHGLGHWDWAGGSLIATEAGAVVRVPVLGAPARTNGAPTLAADGLGADLTMAAAPGIAAALHQALLDSGAAHI